MSQERPLRVAIVGAGPAGFYAAASLLKHPTRTVHIDMFDRLAVPFGLVRAGVAPDHANIKAVTRAYQRTAGASDFRFFGQVTLGRDLTVDDLDAHYDQWVITVGCADDRKLGIPGDDLIHSRSAREFVAWYNGHPDHSSAEFPLALPRVGIIGLGNVAIDVARILCKSPDELGTTDIASHAVDALRASQVQQVTLFARRGPATAACTPKELAELGALTGVDVIVDPAQLDLDTHTLPDDPHPNVLANLDILREFAHRPRTGAPRSIRIEFFASPVRVLGETQVTGLEVARTALARRGDGWAAVATDERVTVPMDLLFRSIGYQGHRIAGLAYDERRGGLANRDGQLLDAAGGEPLARGFVAGWAKRGPSGVIGTNRSCAQDTADLMIAREPDLRPLPPPDALPALLASRGVRVVTWQDWETIDKHEQSVGSAVGKPREKVVTHEGFTEVLDAS